MQSRSLKAYSLEELARQLEGIRAGGFSPTTALAFVHIRFDPAVVARLLSEAGLRFMGASAAGEFIDEEIDVPSIVVLLLELEPSSYRLLRRDVSDSDTLRAARALGEAGREAFEKPAFIVLGAGGFTIDGETLVRAIGQTAGPATPVYGGLASDDLKFQRMFLVDNDGVWEDALAALVIDTGRIAVRGLAFGGWKPMGIVRTVTRSEGNKVFRIDDEPAVDLIARYGKVSRADLAKGTESMFNLASNFQLQVSRQGSYPIMMAPVLADVDEGSLVFSGTVPQGATLQFSLAPGFEVVDNVIDAFTRLKESEPDPDALLLFSCKGREMVLGPWIADEVERVKQLWTAPMAGFLCYGEIGEVSPGKPEFHNMTCSLVLLQEIKPD